MKIDGGGAKTTPSVDQTCKGESPLKSGAVIMGVEAVVFEIFRPSSWWFDEIRHWKRAFARRTTSCGLFKTARFRRNIRITMSDVPTKAFVHAVYSNLDCMTKD